MADTFTSNLNLTRPEVGASADTWGDKLNANLTALDAQFPAIVQSFRAQAWAADRLPYATSATTFAVTPFSAFMRTVLDDGDAVTARATLGVTAEVAALNASIATRMPIAGGTFTGAITAPNVLIGSNGALRFEVPSASSIQGQSKFDITGNAFSFTTTVSSSNRGFSYDFAALPGVNNLAVLEQTQSFTGRKTFSANQAASTSMANRSGTDGGLECIASGSGATAGAAFMTFHRPNQFGAHFGIDTDNQLKFGGFGTPVLNTLWHNNNFNPAQYAALSGASFSGAVSVAGALTANTGVNINDLALLGTVSGAGTDFVLLNFAPSRFFAYQKSTQKWVFNGGTTVEAVDFTRASDARLKEAIKPLKYRGRLKPVEYTISASGRTELGFIAQDVEELYPELVNSSGEYKSLSYMSVTAVLAAQMNRDRLVSIALAVAAGLFGAWF